MRAGGEAGWKEEGRKDRHGSWIEVPLTRSGSATMKKNVMGSCGMSVKSQKPVSCGTFSCRLPT